MRLVQSVQMEMMVSMGRDRFALIFRRCSLRAEMHLSTGTFV